MSAPWPYSFGQLEKPEKNNSADNIDNSPNELEDPSLVRDEYLVRVFARVFNANSKNLKELLIDDNGLTDPSEIPAKALALLSNDTKQADILQEFHRNDTRLRGNSHITSTGSSVAPPKLHTYMLPVERHEHWGTSKNSYRDRQATLFYEKTLSDPLHDVDNVRGVGLRGVSVTGTIELCNPRYAVIWIFPTLFTDHAHAKHFISGRAVSHCTWKEGSNNLSGLSMEYGMAPTFEVTSSLNPVTLARDTRSKSDFEFITFRTHGVVQVILHGNLNYALHLKNANFVLAAYEPRQRTMKLRTNGRLEADVFERSLMWVTEEDLLTPLRVSSSIQNVRSSGFALYSSGSFINKDIDIPRLRESLKMLLPKVKDDSEVNSPFADPFESPATLETVMASIKSGKGRSRGYSLIPRDGSLEFTRTGMVYWHGVPLNIRPDHGCTDGGNLVLFMPYTGGLENAIPLARLVKRTTTSHSENRFVTPKKLRDSIKNEDFSESPYSLQPYIPHQQGEMHDILVSNDWPTIMEELNTYFGPPSSSFKSFSMTVPFSIPTPTTPPTPVFDTPPPRFNVEPIQVPPVQDTLRVDMPAVVRDPRTMYIVPSSKLVDDLTNAIDVIVPKSPLLPRSPSSENVPQPPVLQQVPDVIMTDAVPLSEPPVTKVPVIPPPELTVDVGDVDVAALPPPIAAPTAPIDYPVVSLFDFMDDEDQQRFIASTPSPVGPSQPVMNMDLVPEPLAVTPVASPPLVVEDPAPASPDLLAEYTAPDPQPETVKPPARKSNKRPREETVIDVEQPQNKRARTAKKNANDSIRKMYKGKRSTRVMLPNSSYSPPLVIEPLAEATTTVQDPIHANELTIDTSNAVEYVPPAFADEYAMEIVEGGNIYDRLPLEFPIPVDSASTGAIATPLTKTQSVPSMLTPISSELLSIIANQTAALARDPNARDTRAPSAYVTPLLIQQIKSRPGRFPTVPIIQPIVAPAMVPVENPASPSYTHADLYDDNWSNFGDFVGDI